MWLCVAFPSFDPLLIEDCFALNRTAWNSRIGESVSHVKRSNWAGYFESRHGGWGRQDCAVPQVLQSRKRNATKTTQKSTKTHVNLLQACCPIQRSRFQDIFQAVFEELVYAVICKVPSNLPKLLFLLSVQHSALGICNAQLERTCSWFHDIWYEQKTCEVKQKCLRVYIKSIRSFIIDVILAWKVQMAKPASMLYLKPPILFKAVNQFTNSSRNSSPTHWLSEWFECFLNVPWDVSFLC